MTQIKDTSYLVSLVNLCQQQKAAGRVSEDVIAFLREQGCSIGDSVFIVARAFGIELGEAKETVCFSKTWLDSRFVSFINLCQQYKAAGKTSEEIIAFLREQGCSKGESVPIVVNVFGIELDEAKETVYFSKAWLDPCLVSLANLCQQQKNAGKPIEDVIVFLREQGCLKEEAVAIVARTFCIEWYEAKELVMNNWRIKRARM